MPKSKDKPTVRKLSIHEYTNGILTSAVGPGSGYEFVKRYFSDAAKSIRISSVFFSLKGFQLGQEYVKDHVVYHILVGRDDGHDVQEAILNEITEEMRQPGVNLTNVIKELVDRIRSEKFYIKSAKSISQPFHCKFYICDDKVGWHGSSNYANNGLRINAEQVSLFPHPNDIIKFTSWFDNVASESEDLLGPLLKLLELWLNMARPFDVYLKALGYLLGNKENENRPYAPVFFQQILVQAATRQIKEYGGSFIVAATGLGKTIIGSEIALNFIDTRGAKTIILIAPPLVHKKWKTQFIERGITANFFSITTPFLISKDNADHQIDQLIRLTERADKNTLIIIDEAHYYRNQQAYETLRDKVSRVYRLFKPATDKGARILLLTATVFGTTLDNLNGLLRLLPYHTIQNELHTIDGPWQVDNVSDFPLLDVVNVMSISHVLTIARKLNHVEDGQPYVKYPDKKVFLPRQLELHRILYKLPLESEVQGAFDKRFFSQRDNFHIPYFDDETGKKKKAPVNFLYKVALNSWLSSPAALTEAIEHNLATPDSAQKQLTLFQEEVSPENDEENELVSSSGAYKLSLEESLDRRRQALKPILSVLSKQKVDDDKFTKLIDIIDRHHVQQKGKVLIFIRRHTTALYLFTRLSVHYKKTVSLGCTVEKLNGSIRLTSRSKRDKLLFHFSPSSFPERKRPYLSIGVLICTDADGLGVDLPEADTVVNYDIPEGADVLFQRAGRILRMTIQKNRHVHFYTFVPSLFNKTISDSSCHRAVIGKFNRLIKRHQNASKVLDGDVLSDQTDFSVLLNDKIINDIENFMKQADMSEDLSTSIKNTKLEHELVLLEHQELYKSLPGFVHSARYHQTGTYLVFLLINWNDKLLPILYNAGTKTIDFQNSELDILNRIACTPDTEKAFIPTSVVEKLCDYALEAWCNSEPEQARKIEETRKWCAMILLPKPASHKEAMNNFSRLIEATRPNKKAKKRPEKKSQKSILNLFDG